MSLLADLQAQLDTLRHHGSELSGQIDFLNGRYAADHYGGQTPSQFAAILSPLQSDLSSTATQITDITTQYNAEQAAEQANVYTPGGRIQNPPMGTPIFTPIGLTQAAGGSKLIYVAIAALLFLAYKHFKKK